MHAAEPAPPSVSASTGEGPAGASHRRGVLAGLESARITGASGSGDRIASVDALRGFDMFWIMGGDWIVTSLHLAMGTSTTAFLAYHMDHAEWEGFRFYDIIMPLFLWLAGVSIPFAYSKRLSRTNSKAALWPQILKRVAILWILGMAVQGGLLTYDPAQFSLFSNTLQAIAVGYLGATILALYLPVRIQLLVTGVLMAVFWWVMENVPVPGVGAGFHEPDLNIALWIDMAVLGRFQDGTNYTWILSSMNFVATVMLGVFAGYLLRSGLGAYRKVLALAVAGAALVCLGLLWSGWHPLIKQLWTGSFVLFSAGLCFLLLGVFYLVIDVWHVAWWAKPFMIIGANSIVAYVAWHLFDFGLVADVFLAPLETKVGDWWRFVHDVGATLVLFWILALMHRHRFFVKI
ncbi:MAG: DUF5009 domain-containing protein [Nigerium sp.]|nr:DUF5009 domain-containing protein [Nigerium sp.]